jgi:hypothetical protein
MFFFSNDIFRLTFRKQECPERPFVMIGHCFGGLVIEEVQFSGYTSHRLIFQAMLEALVEEDKMSRYCAGIIFLGTPHRGTDTFRSSGELMAAILQVAQADSDLWKAEPDILKDLANTGSNLSSISDRFARFVVKRKIQIVCFYENRQSDVSKLVPGQGTTIPMVSEYIYL